MYVVAVSLALFSRRTLDLCCSYASSLVLGSSPFAPGWALDLGHHKLYLGLPVDPVSSTWLCSDLPAPCWARHLVVSTKPCSSVDLPGPQWEGAVLLWDSVAAR